MNSSASEHRVRGWLAAFAFSVILGMQAGTVYKPLGTVGETRVADWLDLLTPYLILGCAAALLSRVSAARPVWVLFGLGAVTFTIGHGMHLSANSVSNVANSEVAHAPIVHLWDEIVSHWIWYSGLIVVLVAIALALRRVRFRVGAGELVLAALLAVTLTNTYIEGGTPWLGLVFLGATTAAAFAWRPTPIARLMLIVGGLGLVLLVGWGLFWYLTDGRVFPQFSELGWI